MREPDTRSHTVERGNVWEFGFGEMVSAAFATDGLCYLLVVKVKQANARFYWRVKWK